MKYHGRKVVHNYDSIAFLFILSPISLLFIRKSNVFSTVCMIIILIQIYIVGTVSELFYSPLPTASLRSSSFQEQQINPRNQHDNNKNENDNIIDNHDDVDNDPIHFRCRLDLLRRLDRLAWSTRIRPSSSLSSSYPIRRKFTVLNLRPNIDCLSNSNERIQNIKKNEQCEYENSDGSHSNSIVSNNSDINNESYHDHDSRSNNNRMFKRYPSIRIINVQNDDDEDEDYIDVESKDMLTHSWNFPKQQKNRYTIQRGGGVGGGGGIDSSSNIERSSTLTNSYVRNIDQDNTMNTEQYPNTLEQYYYTSNSIPKTERSSYLPSQSDTSRFGRPSSSNTIPSSSYKKKRNYYRNSNRRRGSSDHNQHYYYNDRHHSKPYMNHNNNYINEKTNHHHIDHNWLHPIYEWYKINIQPNIKNWPKIQCKIEPTTTLKIRKTFRPFKTIVRLSADFNTQLGVWQFQSSWEDTVIGGKLTFVSGREIQFQKSWQLSVVGSPALTEDLVTRLKLRTVIDLHTWKAYVRIGFRTEHLSFISNAFRREGFAMKQHLPLDGHNGHVKLEVKANFILPEPEIEYSTETHRSLIGMGDIEVGIEELNLLLDY